MDQVFIFFVGSIVIALLSAYIGSVAWAIGDAQRRGQSGCGILLLIWLFGPLFIVAWIMVRPSQKVVDQFPDDYKDAESAFEAATQLEKLGEWDAVRHFTKILVNGGPSTKNTSTDA